MGQSTEPEHPDNSTQVIDPIARLTAPDTLPTAPNARQETRVSNPHVSEFLEGQILASPGDVIMEFVVVLVGEVAVVDPRRSADSGIVSDSATLIKLRSWDGFGAAALGTVEPDAKPPRHSFKLVALTEGKMLRIPPSDFLPLLSRFQAERPDAARQLLTAVVRKQSEYHVLCRDTLLALEEQSRRDRIISGVSDPATIQSLLDFVESLTGLQVDVAPLSNA